MNVDKDKVMAWLDRHWKRPRLCQVCGNSAWMLMDFVWELREFQGGDFVIGDGEVSPVLPAVALMCNVCGHQIFFNAIAVNAITGVPSQEEQSEQ